MLALSADGVCGIYTAAAEAKHVASAPSGFAGDRHAEPERIVIADLVNEMAAVKPWTTRDDYCF
jgi:hypothetical protein